MGPRSPLHRPDRQPEAAQQEVITLHTKSGDQTFDALVLSKRADRIQVLLPEGAHSVFCELKPTADTLAYVGTSLGREIFYERSRADVEADIAKRSSAESDSPSW